MKDVGSLVYNPKEDIYAYVVKVGNENLTNGHARSYSIAQSANQRKRKPLNMSAWFYENQLQDVVRKQEYL